MTVRRRRRPRRPRGPDTRRSSSAPVRAGPRRPTVRRPRPRCRRPARRPPRAHSETQRRPHVRQGLEQARAHRVDATPSTRTDEPGRQAAATTEKPPRTVAGNADGGRPSSGWPATETALAPSAAILDGHVGAEDAQHPFRVVARALRLDDRGDAGRVQAGQQHGRLDLGRRRGKPVFDGKERSPTRSRRAAAGRRRGTGRRRPSRAAGAAARAIGRRRREASPVKKEVNACPAATPISRRTPVPALPMSRTRSGSPRPPTPQP